MWAMAGVPIDSAGRDRGEANAPAALRAAGIAALPGVEDHGDLAARIADPSRDPATGVIGYRDLVRASAAIAGWVAATVAAGSRPLLVGGDCSLLTGAFAGLRRTGVEAGLWMVDGHPDALDGASSPTGEAADMDLAFLLGGAPPELAALGGGRALVAAERVVLLGHRPAELGPEVAAELARVPEAVVAIDAPAVIARGPAAVGEQAARRLAGRPAWLHLDLDVLDRDVFAAVTYPQPLGLDWEALGELVGPLAASASLAGISLADFEPDRDPGGEQAARVVALIGEVIAATRG